MYQFEEVLQKRNQVEERDEREVREVHDQEVE